MCILLYTEEWSIGDYVGKIDKKVCSTPCRPSIKVCTVHQSVLSMFLFSPEIAGSLWDSMWGKGAWRKQQSLFLGHQRPDKFMRRGWQRKSRQMTVSLPVGSLPPLPIGRCPLITCVHWEPLPTALERLEGFSCRSLFLLWFHLLTHAWDYLFIYVNAPCGLVELGAQDHILLSLMFSLFIQSLAS